MKTELLFYSTGAFFFIGAMYYFAVEDIFGFNIVTKSILIFIVSIILLGIGIYLKWRNV